MTAATIRKYLDEHPEIYRRFEREALRMIRARGFRHYSARTIMEFLRHNSNLEADPSKHFKVNNDIVPTLARDFMNRNPEAPAGFFETRAATALPHRPEPAAFRLEP